jgi:alpha-glucosidase (family GH31 glycosyl hydrolase)
MDTSSSDLMVVYGSGESKIDIYRNQANGRDEWQPGMAIVDFTNPEACKWYVGLIHTLMDTGVDTIKTDFGERIPHLDVVYHDGSDPRYVDHLLPLSTC